MARKRVPTPPGCNPYLAPFGGWKIAYGIHYGETDINKYRCVECRTIHDETFDYCPNCNTYMKGEMRSE